VQPLQLVLLDRQANCSLTVCAVFSNREEIGQHRFDSGACCRSTTGTRWVPAHSSWWVHGLKVAETARGNNSRNQFGESEGQWPCEEHGYGESKSCLLEGSCSPLTLTEANRVDCCVVGHGHQFTRSASEGAAALRPWAGTRTKETDHHQAKNGQHHQAV